MSRTTSFKLGERTIAFFAFLFLLLIFYPDLFFAKSASLAGDHWEQHYPWAFLLADSLKHFRLPFWTPLIQCGFPITAEGQIGTFYLPNLILYFFLPIHWAYSYVNVFHFLLSGWGTYLYARKIKMEPFPAFAAGFIFLFGTGYGGAYYNITSLKTITWFPFMLYFFEEFLQSKKLRAIFGASVAVALALLAGYLQVAIFTVAIFLIYGFIRFIFLEEKLKKQRIPALLFLLGTSVLGFILASPQLLLTYQIAILSNRTGLSESYAYVGSMSPLTVSTLLFPLAQGLFRGNSLYVGLFPILLTLFAACSPEVRKQNFFTIWAWMSATSFLLAIGRWSPLYVLLIKLTRFYSFRTPMKFLIFCCFSFSILSGIGLQKLMHEIKTGEKDTSLDEKVKSAFFFICILFFASAVFIYGLVTLGHSRLVEMGDWYIKNSIYGKIGHPLSAEEYHKNLLEYLAAVKKFFITVDFWHLWSYGLLAAHLILAALIRKLTRQTWFKLGLLFLFADLFVFSWRDIRLDFGQYEIVEAKPAIVQVLEKEKAEGKVGRIYGFRKPDESLPLVPSVNMIYGIPQMGAYSPFVFKRYQEAVGLFGNVNDSNLAYIPTPGFVLQHLPLLDFLDVSHILSTQPLLHPDYQKIFRDLKNQIILYRNKRSHSPAHFVSKVQIFENWEDLKKVWLAPGFDPAKTLLLEKSELRDLKIPVTKSFAIFHRDAGDAEREVWTVESTGPGIFVLSNASYPGWEVRLNLKKARLITAYGLFQSVWIPAAGKYEVEFSYHVCYKIRNLVPAKG